MTILTKEHLPAFIYLTDQIIAYDFESKDAEVDNIYSMIADSGPGANNGSISSRSISRAFNLRKNLRRGKIVAKDFSRPHIRTLNTLTLFHYEGEHPTRFKIFEKTYKEDISRYYEANRPSEEIVALIFKKRPEKQELFARKQEDLEDLLARVVESTIDDLKKELSESKERFEAFQRKTNDDIKVQNGLIAHLKIEIKKMQSKRKRAALIYRFFGSFGLFLVQTDYRDIRIDDVFDDYLDDFDGIEEEDILDDII